jgi:hypothetical protein
MPRKCTVSQLRWHARRIPCWGRRRVSSANGLKTRISDLWPWARMLSAQSGVCMRTLKNRKQSWELSARTLLVIQERFHKFKQCSVVWVSVHCNNKFFCSLKLWLPHSVCNGSPESIKIKIQAITVWAAECFSQIWSRSNIHCTANTYYHGILLPGCTKDTVCFI